MKRIIIFICMKVAEIAAIVFIPYGVGKVSLMTIGDWLVNVETAFQVWVCGLMSLVSIFIGVMACTGIFLVIVANWRKATEWANK